MKVKLQNIQAYGYSISSPMECGEYDLTKDAEKIVLHLKGNGNQTHTISLVKEPVYEVVQDDCSNVVFRSEKPIHIREVKQ